MLGTPELVIIAIAAALFIVGPKQLPRLGSAVGKTVKNIREGMEGDESDATTEKPAPAEATAVDVSVPSDTDVDTDSDADVVPAVYCSACGTKNDAGAAFCSACGNKLSTVGK